MANEVIGRIKCWCCGSGRAAVSVTKGGRVCVTCRACHLQMFARSDYSDTVIRGQMKPEERAAPAPVEPAPGQEIAVGDALTVATERAALKVAASAPAVKDDNNTPEEKPARKPGAFGW